MELHGQSFPNNEKFSDQDLKDYLKKISDEALYAYNVYQIEGEGENCLQN